MAVLLDASALLAYLNDEAGADVVLEAIAGGDAAMSVVNWGEVLSTLASAGDDPVEVAHELEEEGLIGETVQLEPLTPDDAVAVAQLRPMTRDLGLSFCDRSSIATAIRLGVTVVTADRQWADLEIDGLSVEVIR